MNETCPRCGAVVADRGKHGAFHTELERLAASVADHHRAYDAHDHDLANSDR